MKTLTNVIVFILCVFTSYTINSWYYTPERVAGDIIEENNFLKKELGYSNDFSVKESIHKQEKKYCNEIDNYVSNMGYEIDADKYDIESVESMEMAAIALVGEKDFYLWRNKYSKEAWDYDVMIARYCY